MKNPTYADLSPAEKQVLDEKVKNLDKAIKEAMECLPAEKNPFNIFGFTSVTENKDSNKGSAFICGSKDSLVKDLMRNRCIHEEFRDVLDAPEDPIYMISMLMRN